MRLMQRACCFTRPPSAAARDIYTWQISGAVAGLRLTSAAVSYLCYSSFSPSISSSDASSKLIPVRRDGAALTKRAREILAAHHRSRDQVASATPGGQGTNDISVNERPICVYLCV